MSTTLTNGLKLPDKGSVDWYADMQNNYTILDGAVGTIADHTTAIAGKAPLVHTHNKSDITDFPAYGTTAGTICEGNDSRLSDARTPVAHTHGKADITDLFNSANTWTAQNTYTVTGDVPIKITNNKDATNPSASEIKHIRFVDANAKIIGGLGNSLELGGTSKMYLYSRSFSSDGSSNSNHGLLIINNKQTGVHEVQSESNFIPSANNSYDLGSSSYQWNKIYSADVVHTSGNETITGVKTFSNSLSINGSSPRLQTKSTTYSSATSSGMTIGDIAFLNKDGGFSAWIVHQLRDDLTKRLCFRVYPHTSTTYRGFVFDDTCTLYPENSDSALGSSNYQWNNLYAKNYFYNGTAWGLDQANVWNTYQTIKGYYFGNEQSTNGRTCLYLTSNRDTVGQSGIYITKFRQNRVQGGLQTADLHYLSFDVLENSIRTNGALQLNVTNWNNDVPSGAVLFSNLSNAHLGSSLIPWKTLNGTNPGALSFPDMAHGDPVDTTNWVVSPSTNNSYMPSENGWLNVVVADSSPSGNEFSLYIKSTNFFATAVHKLGDIDDSKGKVGLFIPVIAGITYYVVVKSNTSNITISATLYPCFGSV